MTRPHQQLPSTSPTAALASTSTSPRNRTRTVGHLLVNAQRNVFAADPEATVLLQDGIAEASLAGDRLEVRDAQWAAEIDDCLARVGDSGPCVTVSPLGELRLELRRLTRVSFTGSGPLTLVTVQSLLEPTLRREDAAGGVARTFGLSAAETRVLDALCRGFRLRDYAARRPVSIHTARTQLKSLMAKLRVHSQVEVVRVALQHELLERGAA